MRSKDSLADLVGSRIKGVLADSLKRAAGLRGNGDDEMNGDAAGADERGCQQREASGDAVVNGESSGQNLAGKAIDSICRQVAGAGAERGMEDAVEERAESYEETIAQLKCQIEENAKLLSEAIEKAQEKGQMETRLRSELEEKERAYAEAMAQRQEWVKREEELRGQMEQAVEKANRYAEQIGAVQAQAEERTRGYEEAIRQLKEQVEEQARLRTEAMEKVEQAVQSQERLRGELAEKEKAYGDAMAEVREKAESEGRLRLELAEKERVYVETMAEQQKWIEREAELKAQAEQAEEKARGYAEEVSSLQREAREKEERLEKAILQMKGQVEANAKTEMELIEILSGLVKHRVCEGCGMDDMKAGRLVRIDSGQLLCMDCLDELKSARACCEGTCWRGKIDTGGLKGTIGPGWIRTNAGLRQRVYSPSPQDHNHTNNKHLQRLEMAVYKPVYK